MQQIILECLLQCLELFLELKVHFENRYLQPIQTFLIT